MHHPHAIVVAACLTLASGNGVKAAAPLGLTQLSSSPSMDSLNGVTSRLAVIDDFVYVNDGSLLRSVNESGVGSPITLDPVVAGVVASVTPPVRAADGGTYFVANAYYLGIPDSGGFVSSLYSLEDLTSPVTTWDVHTEPVFAIDSSLKGYSSDFESLRESREYFPNGTTAGPIGPSGFIGYSLTANGILGGSAQVPGTLGSGTVVRAGGTFSFLNDRGSAAAVADVPGGGFNVGYSVDNSVVEYSDGREYAIDGSLGQAPEFTTLVTASDFVILRDQNGRAIEDERIFFPGVSAMGEDRSVGLLEVFPEIGTLNLQSVIDVTSVDQRVYLLMEGDDGLWLFVAPDPTLVPEPASASVVALAFLLGCKFRRS